MIYFPSIFVTIFIAISSFLIILINGSIFSHALSFSKVDNDIAWHISALKISYDSENKIYVAEGEVIIKGLRKKPEDKKGQPTGENRLEADYVEFSNITLDAVASGNVLLISGKDSITCDRLKLNLETEKGTIYNGVVFIEENHFYIKGDSIEKSGKDTYLADKASVTSCDGENPDWKLSGKDIKITIDGYGTAKNATFWAGKVPALYSPVLLFPAKTTRQTGLLTPQFSSSDKKGFEFEQPLFIAISKSSDATIYENYMSKRGIKTSLEYRYVLNNDSFGTLFYDYFNDSHIGETSLEEVFYGLNSGSNRYLSTRNNHDRYWFRIKSSHLFDDNWHTRLDIDYVSDSDYLHEFQDGFTGFDTVKNYFRDTFGRSIDEYDDTTRENILNINRRWTSASLNMGVQWFDNVKAKQISNSDKFIDINQEFGKDTTLQKLPFIEFNTIKKQLGRTPFYYDLDSEYRYFYRQNSYNQIFYQQNLFDKNWLETKTLQNGHRTDIFPRVYMPFQLGSFYLEPSAGVRQTLWYADDFSAINSGETGTNNETTQMLYHREVFDSNVELSTKLSKIFKIDTKTSIDSIPSKTDSRSTTSSLKNDDIKSVSTDNPSLKIKHEILPKIKYSFTPEINQGDELPYFDTIDCIDNKNHFTWSLGNRLTSRDKYGLYNEFAWIEISQSYRMDSDETNIMLQTDEFFQSKWVNFSELSNIEKHPFKLDKHFSDILTEIEYSPNSFLSFNSDVKWSPYNNRFTAHDSGMTIKDKRGDTIQAFYRYQDSELEYAASEVESLLSESFFYHSLIPNPLSSRYLLAPLSSQVVASESLFTSLSTKVTESLDLFFILEHDLINRKTIESHAGFYFNRPCWAMRIAYSDTPEDKSLSFMFNLNGIGEFGKR
ncbi:MAG: LPS-assembly protein LptD [Desulfamplus sp.]|nr:LPS-assembly protein LptD [Desulfamplus sp.]